ncbi:MAG: cohesin domain-containing protein, partial [Bacteroidota bacterium]
MASIPVFGQNITSTIGSINSSTCAVGDTLVVPITTTMASGISTSAISLAIDYDTTKLQCISSVTGLNSASAGFLSSCGLFTNQSPNAPFNASTRRQFRAAWFALTPVTINGLMFNLRFRVLSTGNSEIKWDIATPGNAEYADEFADVIPNVSWVNGTITCGAAVPPCGITLSSAPSTTNQAICQNTNIANILYATTAATGATVTGLPAGVTGAWANNTVTISGTPTATGTFNYTVTLSGCTGGTGTSSGTLTVNPNNTITLSSAAGSNAQNLTIGTAITNITYTTTRATGANFSGLPAGVTGTWASNTVAISGTPTATGTFNYTVTMTGGCTNGTNTATGSIAVSAPAGPNIATSIGAVTGCIGDTVSVPVTINMASGISTAAISMAIGYDPTKLQCISSVTSLNSNISAGFLSNCGVFSGTSQFRAAWFNLSPVAFNGLMFNVRFKILAAGTHNLEWDLATPGNCEYADELADVIPNTTWTNGTVSLAAGCVPPCTVTASITAAGNTTFCQGGSVVLYANTGTGLTYQWRNNGNNIAGATNASYTATTAGAYSVVVNNSPTCSA